MLIVVDANSICNDPLLEGVAWGILALGETEWSAELVVPAVAVYEAEAHYAREVRDILQATITKRLPKARSLKLEPYFEDLHQRIGAAVEHYPALLRQRLQELGARVVDAPDVDHLTLVRRATERRRPCDSNGNGYRDTLNWFTLLDLIGDHVNQQVYWVSNDGDFANDAKDDWHENLAAELAALGARDHVHLVADLNTLVMRLAGEHSEVTGDVERLREIRQNYQRKRLESYIVDSVLPRVVGTTLNRRRCGLPFEAASARVLEVDQPATVELDLRGTVGGEDVVRFTVTCATYIAVHVRSAPDSADIAEEPSLTFRKPLVFSGLITVNRHSVPQQGEITSCDALTDDPGLAAWKRRTKLKQARGRYPGLLTAPLAALDFQASVLPIVEALNTNASLVEGLGLRTNSLAELSGVANIAESLGLDTNHIAGLGDQAAHIANIVEGLGLDTNFMAGLGRDARLADSYLRGGHAAAPSGDENDDPDGQDDETPGVADD